MNEVECSSDEIVRIRKIQGERILRLLNIVGKKPIDMHRFVGYSGNSMIYQIIKGERFMSRDKMKLAADFLGVDESILSSTKSFSDDDLEIFIELHKIKNDDHKRLIKQFIKTISVSN